MSETDVLRSALQRLLAKVESTSWTEADLVDARNAINRNIDTGDVVHHIPSGEDWLVGRVDGDKLYWLGWPPGGWANLSDCRQIKKVGAEERTKTLMLIAQFSHPLSGWAHATLVKEYYSKAIQDVISERVRQITRKGYDEKHDDEHDRGDLSAGASAYALAAADKLHPMTMGDGHFDARNPPDMWPDNWEFKAGPPRRMLMKSAAMIIAEMEAIDRQEAALAASTLKLKNEGDE